MHFSNTLAKQQNGVNYEVIWAFVLQYIISKNQSKFINQVQFLFITYHIESIGKYVSVGFDYRWSVLLHDVQLSKQWSAVVRSNP